MTLIEEYQLAISKDKLTDSPLQRQILVNLQRVADELIPVKNSWLQRERIKPVTGIYLYGPVGGGKTFLMDLLYQHVNEPHKARFHFHHFMQQIDARLRHLQGKSDPLKRIAADIAKTTRLLFLDEFLVQDIAVAMILSELLQALFSNDVVLIATSNTRPDDLYLNGLQRARFLPAIEQIKTHCQLLVLADHRDYRLGRTSLLQAYLYPLNEVTDRIMVNQFHAIGIEEESDTTIMIQNRKVPCIKIGAHAVWFKFSVICDMPRSQLDYLEIATRFDTVFVSDMPTLESNQVGVILLTQFIDVMYDQGIRVVISASGPLDLLFPQAQMPQTFQRTFSRLQEMQSIDYLQRRRQLNIT